MQVFLLYSISLLYSVWYHVWVRWKGNTGYGRQHEGEFVYLCLFAQRPNDDERVGIGLANPARVGPFLRPYGMNLSYTELDLPGP